MRLYQLLESDKSDYELIYDTLKKDCSEFYRVSDGFRYVPYREDSISHSVSNLFQLLYKYETRPIRTSVITQFKSTNIIETFDMISKANGNASRIEHMVTTSSLGMNPSYPVSSDDYLIFPIGKFTYSYISDDFNNHTDSLSAGIVQVINRLSQHPKWDSEKKNILSNREIMKKYYYEIIDDLTLNNESKNIIKMDFVENINIIFHLLHKITTGNYLNAFEDESEIWFNCKSYYAMANVDFQNMIKSMKN